jgi:hypothetical protein
MGYGIAMARLKDALISQSGKPMMSIFEQVFR